MKAMAERVEITELLEAHPYDLSGGEQQRVALAKVLLARPDADTVLRGELGVAERVAWTSPLPLDDIKAPDAIAIDRSYLGELGVSGIGDSAQAANGRVKIRALTEGIRSFTQSPYAYTTLNRARQLLGVPEDRSTFLLVKLAPGADMAKVQADLAGRLESADVLTKDEFESRSLLQWLFRTGAGLALIGGAILGSLVGTVIVAQTLYSSTKDHIHEFATLRALGSSKSYIHKVILAQAGLSAVIGYVLGMAIALLVLYASRNSSLPLVMTPGLAFWLFALTLFMCSISALSAIVKVTKIDPATVFSR